MKKLKLQSTNRKSINDAEKQDIGSLTFDLAQFNIPQLFVVEKNDILAKIERSKNAVGEQVETGLFSITFKVYDRAFIELVINNNGTEIGSPISILVENQADVPNLENFEDGEFIPVSFENLKIFPKKEKKSTFVGNGQPTVDTWQFTNIKVIASAFKLGEFDDKPNAKQ
ncbi:MAG: hypothetical protein ACRC6H_10080 [Culicoidibacterales bacterium]